MASAAAGHDINDGNSSTAITDVEVTTSAYGVKIDTATAISNNLTFGNNKLAITKGTLTGVTGAFSAIQVDGNNGVTFANNQGEIVISGLALGDYAINNTGAGILNFGIGNSIAVGTAPATGTYSTYGISMGGVDGIKYNFGSAANGTTFGAYVGTGAANTDGKNAVGIIVANSAELAGNLTFTAVKGQNGYEQPTTGATDDQGAHGGSAYGIYTTANGKTLTLADGAKITFTTISGGAGEQSKGDAQTDIAGNGGDASGIYLSEANSLTISGNGSLIFTTISGGGKGASGTSGTAGKDGDAFVINNTGTGTLTFGSAAVTGDNAKAATTVSIVAGNANLASHTVGISDNIAGNYVFGTTKTSGTTTTTGSTVLNVAGAAGTSNGAGGNAAGLYFEGVASNVTANFSGNLTANVVGGAGDVSSGSAAGGKGGNAYGLYLKSTQANSNANLALKNSIIALNIKGGTAGNGTAARVAQSQGNTGSAYGIYLDNTTTQSVKISGDNKSQIILNIAEGDAGTIGAAGTVGSAYAIKNGITTLGMTLTFENVGIVTGTQAATRENPFALYNGVASNYDFGEKGTVFSVTGSESEAVDGIVVNANLTHVGKLTSNLAGGDGKIGDANKVGGSGANASGLVFTSAANYAISTGAGNKLEITATGGTGGNGGAGTADGGKGGSAFGIISNVKNAVLTVDTSASATFIAQGGAGGTKTGTSGSSNGAYGDAVGILVKGTIDEASSLAIRGDGALNLKVGNATQSNNGDAYGIKLSSGDLSGNVTFDGTNSFVKAHGTTGTAYALYTEGESSLTDGIILIKDLGATGKAVSGATQYALYNAGVLFLEGNIAVAGDGAATADARFYAESASDVLKAGMAAGSITFIGGDQAFGGQGKVNFNLESREETKQGATLVFSGSIGALNTLEGKYASIRLAEYDQRSFDLRLKAPFVGRTLTINDMQLDKSDFVLGASAINKGADKVEIKGTQSTTASASTPLNNTLYVVLDSYSTSSTPVTLATVASDIEDKVIFNGLTSEGQEIDSTVYNGFTMGEVTIKREADAGNGVKYTSTLEAANIQVNTDFVAPTTAALSAGVSVFSANLNSLSKRMGELRNDPYANGVWARVFAGEQTTDFGGKQSTVYSTFQAGYDYKLALEDASNYIGLALSYTKGVGGQVDPVGKIAPAPLDTLVAGLSSSNTDGVEVALYNSYVANSGLYSDTIVKAGYYMTDLTMFAQPDTYSTSNLAVAVSEEIGYKVKLGESNEWFITPQGEVAFAYIGGTEFTQHDGISGLDLKSTQDATSLLRARVGAAWGYDFSHLAKESDVKASLYVGTYYAYDYFIGGDTTLSTTANGKAVEYTHNAYEGTGRFVMNLGTNIDIKDNAKVYVDFEKSFGGSIQTDYQISLGVRFGFGEKVSAPKPEEKKSSEPILKPKELDENAAE